MGVNGLIDMVAIAKTALESGSKPRYRALANGIAEGILRGRIGHGQKLMPHRILADKLGVTPGTVSKAYGEVERMGLVSSRVGDGTYVRFPGSEPAKGFENAPSAPDNLDLSRNTHIQGDEVRRLSETLLRMGQDTALVRQLLEYAPPAGASHQRQAGMRWLRFSGYDATSDAVLVTNGAQHALLCTLMACLRAGDTVATEHLSYPGLIDAARYLNLRLTGIEIDDEGLIPAAFAEACEQRPIKALYCTPTLQNPTAATLTEARRREIALLCRRYGVLIIEDDAHGCLADMRPPALASFAPDQTVLISSLTKAVGAGLRSGYLAAPPALATKIGGALRASCWMASPLAAEIGAQWVLDGTAEALRTQQRRETQRRKELVAPLLDGFRVRSADGCCHFWISLPEPWRATDLTLELERKRILVKAAESFAVGGLAVPQCLRTSISSTLDEASLIEAFRYLGKVIREGAYVHSETDLDKRAIQDPWGMLSAKKGS